MKIFFISSQLPPIVDGVGDYTLNMAKQFAAHGHEVAVVTKKDDRINTQVEGVKILTVVPSWSASATKPIVKAIRDFKPDIVSLQYVPHGFHPKGLPFFMVRLVTAIKGQKVKLFTFFHEVSVSKVKGNPKRTVLAMAMQWISKKIIEKSDYVATSIDSYRDFILKLSPSAKVTVIPIASNVDIEPASEEFHQRMRQKIADQDEFVVGFFGVRNLEMAIESINILRQQNVKIRILLIGKTRELPKNLTNYYKTGVLGVSDLSIYFAASDVLMLPEGKPSGCSFKSGSLAAMLSSGRPVFTTKGTMTSPLLIDNQNVVFTDFENIEETAKNLSRILHDSDRQRAIGEKAVDLMRNITWEKTFEQYENVLT